MASGRGSSGWVTLGVSACTTCLSTAIGPVMSSGTPAQSATGETLRGLMSAVESLYAQTQDRVAAPTTTETASALLEGSPLAQVAGRVDSKNTRVMAEALGEVLYECRGALDYAEFDAPAHRLARRIVEALVPMAPRIESRWMDCGPTEDRSGV
jgi:hypothetical protein